MPDGGASRQVFDVLVVEDLSDKTQPFLRMLLEAVVCYDARPFLSAVLEGVQRIVGRERGVALRETHTDDAAFLLHPQLSPVFSCQLYERCFDDLPKPQLEQRFFVLW